MTESDWMNSSDPLEMLRCLRNHGKLSERKGRLLAVAVCRRLLPWFSDQRSRWAVEIAEKFADGLAGEDELAAASETASQAAQEERAKLSGYIEPEEVDLPLASDVAATVTRMMSETVAEETVIDAGDVVAIMEGAVKFAEDAGDEIAKVMEAEVEGARPHQMAALVRDVIFNPFRLLPMLAPAVFFWNDACICKLAAGIYEDRDFSKESLGVLADALEEAGVTEVLLEHLRGPGPHVKGCWVIDLLLGKE